MPFVQRNTAGEIIGRFSVPQPGFADEWTEDSPLPELPKRYSKKRLFEAMTGAEYETFETVEAQQPAKDRRVFREAVDLSEADASFPRFSGLLAQVYGEARAAELLASAVI